jgi:hypothetical protein
VAADQRSTNAAPLSPAFAPAALPTLPSEGSAFQPLRTFGASVTGVTGVTGISGAPQLSAADRVAAWNKAHAVGTAVRVQGYADLLRTKSEAMVLFGHRAAVYMDGYNGYFALDEVEAAEESRFRR